ncbi:hypothetical protein COT97_01260 [Candidatus Falkowbacteria bacterium CG10_big_fil_rev_8_21_14_0_10_39_11]|uniref:Uncharacterized protein n=1 Tax=Candidatus Falkowbacteria bacterium CG10_big_fil_rev_8_21_14_0_10_39_11 TaxID=1974565 RepID=A0A2H0V5T6_9BACT|nr:MAG: hypothetical protein COT97_01260 [Candidatus Falkowbacteria bacterium CG10_big_fil_rev_8_21_14_0_10_39_11]
MSEPFDQKKHPEALPGEDWIGNIGNHPSEVNEYQRSGFRVGQVAYDNTGKPIKGMRPIFKSQKLGLNLGDPGFRYNQNQFSVLIKKALADSLAKTTTPQISGGDRSANFSRIRDKAAKKISDKQ